MTRRERRLRIIENFGGLYDSHVRYHRDAVLARRGLEAFTDEAVKELASRLVSGHRHQQQLNARHRARLLDQAEAQL